MSAVNELLEVPAAQMDFLKLSTNNAATQPRKKPTMKKLEIPSSDIRARLTSFLPDMKAANDRLSKESALINIEHLENDDQYIEMDLGLGVLEEQPSNDGSESAGAPDVLSKMLNLAPVAGIQLMEAVPVSSMLCDAALERFRGQCIPNLQFEMDIVLSLMSRILVQLRAHSNTMSVDKITKLNVLREDMYKLMSRRDRLLETQEGRLTHESRYPEELDALI